MISIKKLFGNQCQPQKQQLVKKFLAVVAILSLIFSPGTPVFADGGSPQDIGAGTTAVGVGTGQLYGINFTADGIATLTAGQPLNSEAEVDAATNSAGANGLGTITFAGSSIVTGDVGIAGDGALAALNLNGGAGTTVTINGDVCATDMYVGAGTLQLNGSFLEPSEPNETLIFTGDGEVIVGNDEGEHEGDGYTIEHGIKTNTDGTGTLTFEGDGTVVGQIGEATKYLKAINVTNNGSTVSLGTGDTNSVYVNSLNFFSDGSNTEVTFSGDAFIGQGGVDDGITTASGGYGVVDFNGNATVTGESDGEGGYLAAIGNSDDALDEVYINGGEGTTVTVNGDVYADDMYVGDGILDLNGSFFGNPKTLNFTGNGEVILADGEMIDHSITTALGGRGTLSFEGDGTVTGQVGAGGAYLKTINVAQSSDESAGEGYNVDFDNDVYVNKLNFGAVGEDGGWDTEVTFYGDAFIGQGGVGDGITNESSEWGVVNFEGNATVTGSGDAIGDESHALWQVNVMGGVGTTVTINGNVYAYDMSVGAGTLELNGTFYDPSTEDATLNFTADGAVILGDGGAIEHSITTDDDGTGTLTFEGDGTVTGQVGKSAAYLKTINVTNGSYVINLGTGAANSVYVNSLNFSGDGDNATVGFYGDAFIGQGNEGDGITTGTDGYGIVTFNGNATVTGNSDGEGAAIGSSEAALDVVNISGIAGTTVTVNGDLYAYEINVGAGTLEMNGDLTSPSEFTVYFTADGILKMADGYGINASVVNDTEAGQGTLIFDGSSEVTGTVGGVGTALKAIISDGSGTVTFGDDVYADTITLNGGTMTGEGILNSDGTFDLRSGSISNALAGEADLNKTTAGTVTLSGNNSGFSGATTVSGGMLTLDYTEGGAGADTQKLGGSGADLTLSGGTLEFLNGGYDGEYGEEVLSTTITGGSNNILQTIDDEGDGTVLRMNEINRTGGTINFSGEDIATTITENTNNILGAWATVGGADWAVGSGDGSEAYVTALGEGEGYDQEVTRRSSEDQYIDDNYSNNVLITEGSLEDDAYDIFLDSETTTINTLNQSSVDGDSAATIDLEYGTLEVNGILVGSDAGGLTIGVVDEEDEEYAGYLTTPISDDGGNGEMILINNSENDLIVNSVIENDGEGNDVSLTKSGTGTLVLNGTNTYTGATNLGGGTVSVDTIGDGEESGNLGAATADAENLVFDGGTLLYTGITASTDRGFTVNAGGGEIDVEDGATLTFAGDEIIANGTLTIGGDGNTTISSVIGEGEGLEGSLTKVDAGTLTLSSTNTYTGDTTIDDGILYLTASQDTTSFNFSGDSAAAELRLANGANITGDITATDNDGEGTLTFEGTSVVTGQIGEVGDALDVVDLTGGTSSTVTVNGDLYAYEINVGAGTLYMNGDLTSPSFDTLNFTEDGIVTMAHGYTIDANVSTETNGTGTLTFEGDGEVTGQIGEEGGYLKAINVAQGGDYDVVLDEDVYVNKLNFGVDDEEGGADTIVRFDSDAFIGSGGITTQWADFGIVNFNRNATVTGQVGAQTAYLCRINVAQAATEDSYTVDFNSDVYVDSLNFGSEPDSEDASDTTVTFNGKANVYRDITTEWANAGIVNFNNNATINGKIGDVTDDVTGSGELNEVYFNSGTAVVNKAIHAEDVFVTGNTTLGLSSSFEANGGLVDGNLTVGNPEVDTDTSTLDIGTNTLNITADDTEGSGTYKQVSGTTLKLNITSASTYGKVVAVSADVAAGSKVNVTVPEGASLANGTQFTVISSDASDIDLPTVTSSTRRYAFTASEDADGNLILTSAEGSYAAPSGASGNASGVGNALNGITNPTGDMNNVLNQLGGLSDAEYDEALESMHPDMSSGSAEGGRALTSQGFTTVSNRLGGARSGFSGTGVSAGEMLNGVGVWMQALGSHLKQDMRKGIEGFSANTFGTTIGADKVLDSHFRAGFAGSYGWAGVKSKTAGSPSDNINSYQATIYGSYDSLDLEKSRQGGKKSYEAVRSQVENSWYVDGMFAFTQNNYDSRREIWVTPTAGRVAKADHYAQQYSTNFEAGYKFVFEKTKNLEITPFASLGYNYLYMNQYKEHGANALNLNVSGEGFHQLEQSLGTKVAYPIKSKKLGTFIPSAKAAWLYDYIGDRFESTASFEGGGPSFNTQGAKPAKNGMLFGGELAFLNKGNVTVTGNWDIELKDEFMSNTYYGTVRYDF